MCSPRGQSTIALRSHTLPITRVDPLRNLPLAPTSENQKGSDHNTINQGKTLQLLSASSHDNTAQNKQPSSIHQHTLNTSYRSRTSSSRSFGPNTFQWISTSSSRVFPLRLFRQWKVPSIRWPKMQNAQSTPEFLLTRALDVRETKTQAQHSTVPPSSSPSSSSSSSSSLARLKSISRKDQTKRPNDDCLRCSPLAPDQSRRSHRLAYSTHQQGPRQAL